LYKALGTQREADRVLGEIVGGVTEAKRLDRLTWPQKFRGLWDDPIGRRGLLIVCGLQALQQLCGFNALMYFSATIFQSLGFDKPAATSMLVAATNLVFTLVAFTLIDT